MNSEEFLTRNELLYGKEAVSALKDKKVLLFGLGGVGGYVLETLVRSGVEHFAVVDHDTFSLSNLNRQILSSYDNIGMLKVDAAKEHVLSINPQASVETYPIFFLENNDNEELFEGVDYVIDCIDTISSKIAIITYSKDHDIPIISSMGTGNKMDPTKLQIADLSKTSICPLARVMRRELKKRNIIHLDVLYSLETPSSPKEKLVNEQGKVIIGSSHVVPPVAGIMIGDYVLKQLMEVK